MQRPNEEEKKMKTRCEKKKQLGTQVYVMHVDIMPQLGRKRRKQEKLSWCHILSFAFVSLPRMISLLRPRTFSFARPYSSTPEAGKPMRQRFQSSTNISINQLQQSFAVEIAEL